MLQTNGNKKTAIRSFSHSRITEIENIVMFFDEFLEEINNVSSSLLFKILNERINLSVSLEYFNSQ